MPKSSTTLPQQTLGEIQAALENLSLQLLQSKFLEVNVKAYYHAAETHIQQTLKQDKKYRHEIAQKKPLQTLVRLSIEKIAAAYVLIVREVDKAKVDALLTEYEAMVSQYLEKTGLLA